MATPEGHPVPQGEAGVIHVHGRHLALGYWRDPDLTRASFAGPDAPGAWRRFVTGDVGRVREDGLLEFHGRSDRQVKVRGFRVEPAEAESALRKLEGVRDAAVVVVAHRGENRLVAFVEAPDDKELDEARLVEQAMSGLPPHLLPARLVKVSSIPRLPNFKVDHVALSRQALESMDAPATPGLSDGPRPAPSADPVAAQILEEWERVLGRQLPEIGRAHV